MPEESDPVCGLSVPDEGGASRYDLQGNAVATVAAEEAQYASERMMKELLRTERMRSQSAG